MAPGRQRKGGASLPPREATRPTRRAAVVARSSVAVLGRRRPYKRRNQAVVEPEDNKIGRHTTRAKKRKLEELGIASPAVAAAVKGEVAAAEAPKANEQPAEQPSDAIVDEASPLDRDTQLFLHALTQDDRLSEEKHGRRSIARRFSFELPFSKPEIEHIEARATAEGIRMARRLKLRPPVYGRICKSVYVSNKIPTADLPVHKCTCFTGKPASATTKRATQLASAKALLAGDAEAVKPTRRLKGARQSEPDAEPSPQYCGENCYNRMMFISCSNETCSAPDPSLCSNRAIKRREVKPVRVEFIPGPGFGLIADEAIQAGEFVIEYVGEVIDDAECERRLIKYRDAGETHFYMLELEKDVVIDARYRSNESRFINHSCDPNSVTQKWNVNGIQRVGIFARRNISPDEEITIDYNFSHFGEAVDCKCGSTACRGKIGRKRSEMPSLLPAIAAAMQGNSRKRIDPLDEPIPELKRPVPVSSLALLKSAQLDRAWLHLYGFNKRRLFFSHREKHLAVVEPSESKPKEDGNSSKKSSLAPSSSTSSPVSEQWSTTTEEDVHTSSASSTTSSAAASVTSKDKRNWYERVMQGEHLEEMRNVHSYICGGKSDWTKDLASKRSGRPPKNKPALQPRSKQQKLIRKRLSLLEARARCVSDIVAFAEGKSKWNARYSASQMDPDRIFRFSKHINDAQIFFNPDQNDLNEDACYRCGLAGELICCDGCPAAFHLCCTNLVSVPPAAVPWFCSECTKPKQAKSDSDAANSVELGVGERRRQRQLRTHAAPLVPSLKKIFHSRTPSSELGKRRYKKRARASDRSYRLLEQLPLPSWNESDSDS